MTQGTRYQRQSGRHHRSKQRTWRSCCVILLSTGQTVLGARRLERLQALAEELSFGQSAVQTDVTQYAQVKHLVNHAVHPMQRRRIWDRMIDVNLKGVLYGIAAALPYMKAQKGGHTVISPGAVATELPDSITNPTSQRTYASVTRSPFGTST